MKMIASGVDCFLLAAVILITSSAASAREPSQDGGGGGFDAFTNIIGPGGWIASGKTLGRDEISRMRQGPSRLRSLRGDAITTSYMQPFTNIEGFDLGSVEAVTNRLKRVNAGLSFSQFRVAGIREASGNALTGNIFDAQMNALTLSVAPRRSGPFGYGARLNYYNISIRDHSVSRLGVDLGADYIWNSVRFTGNIRNLLADRSGANAMLMMGEIRGEWSPYEELHLGGTATIQENGVANVQVGAQYDIFKIISVMGGYMSASRQWTAGAKAGLNGVSVQYGLSAHRELDFSHTVSLGIEFGGERTAQDSPAPVETIGRMEVAPNTSSSLTNTRVLKLTSIRSAR